MSAIGWVMIAYSSNCLTSQGWLASIAEGDSIINATLLFTFYYQIVHSIYKIIPSISFTCNNFYKFHVAAVLYQLHVSNSTMAIISTPWQVYPSCILVTQVGSMVSVWTQNCMGKSYTKKTQCVAEDMYTSQVNTHWIGIEL